MRKSIGIKIVLSLLLYVLIVQATYANDFVFTPINASQGLSDNQIRYILQLPDGRMVFTTNGNVNVYNGAQFSYLHRSSEDVFPLHTYDGFYRIYQDSDSLLWIKDNHKLMCIDLYQATYVSELGSYFSKKGIKDSINDFFIDNNNCMWLLTAQGLWQPDASLLLDLSSHQGKLQDLATDNERLYLFYNTGKVVCYHIANQEFLYESAAYPDEELECFQHTSLVVKGKNGFYQLRNGSNRGGCFFFNPQHRTWERLLEQEYHLNTLIITPQEIAYISCAHGLWVIDPQCHTQQYFPTLNTIDESVISTEISTLFYDKQGGLWVGTLNRGLLYYHPQRYKFAHVGRTSFPVSSASDLAVQKFAEDKYGNIYLKCNSDIYQYSLLGGNNKVLTPISSHHLPQEVKDVLLRDIPRYEFQGRPYTALCTDTRGWTWGGTADGLELFVPDVSQKCTFYTEDGLSNNFVHAILEDRHQHIWVTTSCGISQVIVDSLSQKIHFKNYNSYDGTLKGEYVEGAAFEATDGTLYFGGIDGFNVLRPNNLLPSYLPYKPLFTALRLRGEEVKVGQRYDGRVVLSKTAPYTNEIELSYNQNFLTFEFSALNYLNQAKTCYRYILDGVDDTWHETMIGGKGEYAGVDGILKISYTNLAPGRYILSVMASDSTSKWDGEATKLYITIRKPWWKSSIAYCLYVLLILVFSAGGIYLYTYLTKKKLERVHKEEILLLRIRNLIEQCNQYEEGRRVRLDDKTSVAEDQKCNVPNVLLTEENRKSADEEFLARAMEQVERHLDVPGYSVEQLSRDLCVDRTGLYRKLIALLDESPSSFIRNIRLRRAAQLLLETEFSVTEIAERVGFSTSSYMSKCFQEMYGCRPSEYAEKVKKST